MAVLKAFPHLPQTIPALAPAARIAATVRDDRFADLGVPRRVWTVSAINGAADQLADLHDTLAGEFLPGDRLVYLGNYLGAARPDAAALDEIISFRRFLLAMPGAHVDDVVFLRGMMEEMWHKLLQLQFCPNPAEVLDWMEGFGIGNLLTAYGSSLAEARLYLRDRPLGVMKWTNRLRAARRAAPAHEIFASALKRAAFTREISGAPGPLLFVHAGLDPRLPLSQQNDQFWWGWKHYARIETDGFAPFSRVVRGCNPNKPEVVNEGASLTLDGGAGRMINGERGALLLTCFAGAGPHYGQLIAQQGF